LQIQNVKPVNPKERLREKHFAFISNFLGWEKALSHVDRKGPIQVNFDEYDALSYIFFKGYESYHRINPMRWDFILLN